MSEAIFNKSDVFVVPYALIQELKLKAKDAPRRRFRLCLHRSHQDLVQEMIIVFCKDSKIPIHRHSVNKSETFNLMEGMLSVTLFDDKGNLKQKIKLGGPLTGRPSIYRISEPFWHKVELESEIVVVHEIATGPFDPYKKDELPKWAINM